MQLVGENLGSVFHPHEGARQGPEFVRCKTGIPLCPRVIEVLDSVPASLARRYLRDISEDAETEGECKTTTR